MGGTKEGSLLKVIEKFKQWKRYLLRNSRGLMLRNKKLLQKHFLHVLHTCMVRI